MFRQNRIIMVVMSVLLLLFATSVITSLIFQESIEFDYKISDIINSVAAVVGIIAIWYQMKREKDLSEAEFIINLNNSFTSNAEIKNIYRKLEVSKLTNEDPFNEEDSINIVDYLTFFETLNNLLKRRVIKFEMIDDLFSYRFFIAVHNQYIQNRELVKDKEYYNNIYILYKDWTEYRRKKNKPIPFDSNSLDTADERYNNYIRGGISEHCS